jgi:periplasmic protein TonB
MNGGSTDLNQETQPLVAPPRLPQERLSAIASRRLEEGSLAASFDLHGIVALAILAVALLGLWAPPEPEPPLKVTLVGLGPGSAGVSGGDGGGGGEAAEASTPSTSTDTRPTKAEAAPPTPAADAQDAPRQDETEPRQVAEAPATLPAEPLPLPPRRKPPPTRPSAVEPTPQPSAAPSTLDTAQLAAAPLDRPFPGAPGQGSGPGGKTGLGTGATGVGSGAIADGPVEGPGDDYLERLRRWLNKYKRFPEEAQKQKQHGQLVVSFTILRDGTVRDPHVERSSGFPLLDDAALQMLRDASPVPPLPEKYRAPQVAVDLPVEFSIGFLERVF